MTHISIATSQGYSPQIFGVDIFDAMTQSQFLSINYKMNTIVFLIFASLDNQSVKTCHNVNLNSKIVLKFSSCIIFTKS